MYPRRLRGLLHRHLPPLSAATARPWNKRMEEQRHDNVIIIIRRPALPHSNAKNHWRGGATTKKKLLIPLVILQERLVHRTMKPQASAYN